MVRVNFISKDQLLIEKIRYYFRNRDELRIEYSDTPLDDESADIRIAPVHYIKNISLQMQNTQEMQHQMPVIYYGDPSSIRNAFLAGCSDYLKEPWTIEELELRLFRIIRAMKITYAFSWGSITFTDTDIVTEKGRCPLSYQEFRIFNLLLRQRGKAVPRQVLFYALWNKPGHEDSRVIDMHISSIRKKLEQVIPDNMGKEVITSVRGIGYMIK